MIILVVNGRAGTPALVQFGSRNNYSGNIKSTRIKAAGCRCGILWEQVLLPDNITTLCLV